MEPADRDTRVVDLEAKIGLLQAIIGAGTIINSTLDLGTVLEQVMTSAKEVMSAEASTVLLVEEETGDLVCLTATGPAGDRFKELFRIERDTNSIATWVAAKEKPLLIDDAYTDDRFCPDYDRQTGFRTQSIMCLPLKARGKLIGIAQVINKHDHEGNVIPFDEEDREHFEAFCNQAAVGIENARLYHQVLRRSVMERDLEVAAQIQQSFMPVNLPQNERISVHARCVAAMDIGGDMYDVFEIDDDNILVALGDVSGKGASAALYMASVMSDLRGLALRERDPSTIMSKLNNLVQGRFIRGRFITFVLMLFDLKHGTMELANAGHPPAMRTRSDGTVDLISTDAGIPLGFYADAPYPSRKEELRAGDRFFVYTDGFIEAPDKRGDLYGIDRLEKFMSTEEARGEEWINRLYDRVHSFAAPDASLDDLTAVICEIGGLTP